MGNFVNSLVVGAIAFVALTVGYFFGLLENVEDADIQWCPVPPESEVVCGYVHDDNPNYAGLYLRGTGCAEYDGGEG